MIKLHREHGFTLIELMISVAIVGILAAIALPSYQDSIMKSRRADAKTALLELANVMERHFTAANSYCGAADGADSCTGTPTIYTPQHTDYYTITISSATQTTFTLQAVPTGTQTGDTCGNLSLTNTGAKTSDDNEMCW